MKEAVARAYFEEEASSDDEDSEARGDRKEQFYEED